MYFLLWLLIPVIIFIGKITTDWAFEFSFNGNKEWWREATGFSIYITIGLFCTLSIIFCLMFPIAQGH